MPGAPKSKVLYVCHNHPAITPGGAEEYALQVYKGMREAGEFDSVFLARSGPPVSITARMHEGRPVTMVNEDPNQYFFYTDLSDWDWTFGRSPNKSALTRFYADFLLDHQPDVVHFQHSTFLGYEVLRVTRNTLPEAPIVYTLHEFLPICYHDGKMVRTGSYDLCSEASPRRCHECFPLISQQTFFMRERYIRSHMSLVDLFISPSRFLRDRYIEWGIPADKIVYEENGRLPVPAAPERERPHNRFAYFGQLTQYKGIDVLLQAMAQLEEDGFEGELFIHGANLDWAPEDFKERLQELLDKAGGSVTLAGIYEPHELGKLMEDVDWVIMPSIWWENAPLVIQEAFMYGRPVICSDIGGMAEKVTDGLDGLHFRRADPDSLAETMQRAVREEGLWERLRSNRPEVHHMRDHVRTLAETYRALLTGTDPNDVKHNGQVTQLV
jgi:glycosyltransferase involved in cell wall biosynthesis